MTKIYENNIDSLIEELNELKEILEKAHKEEVEWYKLKAENRKRRQEEGLPW